jgi:glycosyltransferase involved in cell wall biosynthesis
MAIKNDDKRILLMLPYGSVGGMERLALTFYEYYKSLGYFVKAVKFIKLESDIINFGADELFLSLKDFSGMSSQGRYLFYLRAPLALRKLIKNHKINYSIAFGDMANLFSSLTFTKEYKIGSIHSFKSIELSSPSIFNKLTSIGYRSSYKNLDKLVCISKTVKEDLILKCRYRFENIEVIYNPHNIDSIRNKSYQKITDTKEEKLFQNEIILFVGRLSLAKAPWHLVNAFKVLQEFRPDSLLVFIGDGESSVTKYLKNLIQYLALDEKVIFLGRKDNPFIYLKQAKCIALTSNFEGTPNVIVEAIALGTPVVTSFCTAGILELMSVDETLCYYNEGILETEAGIITPNFYEGILDIPHSFESIPSGKERLFAKGLEKILEARANGISIMRKQDLLLKKFDLPTIAEQYLTTIN